jgi:tryptophan halogenase
MGGGVTGALAALYFQKYKPNWVITLVENPNISPLPVGENLHRNTFKFFCDVINQPWQNTIKELIELNCTIKLGTKYSGWSNQTWFVPHSERSNSDTTKLHNVWLATAKNRSDIRQYYESVYPDTLECIIGNTISKDYMNRSVDLCCMCVDATEVSSYLKSKFNGHVIYANMVGIERNDRKLTKILLEDGRSVEADLFFDCTGFKRLLIKEFSKFKSIKTAVTNSAYVGPVKHPQNIIPVAVNIDALDNGWMFKIPMQHRSGIGYVFNNQLVNLDKIKDEYHSLTNESKNRILLKWDPKETDAAWNSNVVALGLASFWNEPLMGTSFELTTKSITHFMHYYDSMGMRGSAEYNNWFTIQCDLINTQLLASYYFCKNNHTEFWRYVHEKGRNNNVHEKIVHLAKGGFTDLLRKYPNLMWSQVYYETFCLCAGVEDVNLDKKVDDEMIEWAKSIWNQPKSNKTIPSNKFYSILRGDV